MAMAYPVMDRTREKPWDTALLLQPTARSCRAGDAASSQDAAKRNRGFPLRVRSTSAVLSHHQPTAVDFAQGVSSVERGLGFEGTQIGLETAAGCRASGGPEPASREQCRFLSEFARSRVTARSQMQIEITDLAAKRSES